MENTAGFGYLLVIGFVYFLPWIVASSRNHHNRGAIAVLNLCLGWTGLGWVAALVWSCTNPPVKEIRS